MSYTNVLITGCSGYVGREVCRLFDRAGINWVGVDRAAQPDASTRVLQLDIMETQGLAEVLHTHGITHVVHLAGLAFAGESFERADAYYRTNVLGTSSILNAIEMQPISGLIFASSCSVYGNSNISFVEESQFDPHSPYAASKVAAENLLRDVDGPHSTTVLRFFNVVGGDGTGLDADNHVPEPHILPNLVSAAVLGGSFTVFGTDYSTHDGTAVREYIDVRDIARAIMLSLLNLKRSGARFRVYNIGSEKPHSVFELAQLVGNEIRPVDLKFASRRQGDPDAASSNSSLALRELGWSPKFRIEDSINAQRLFMMRRINASLRQGPE